MFTINENGINIKMSKTDIASSVITCAGLYGVKLAATAVIGAMVPGAGAIAIVKVASDIASGALIANHLLGEEKRNKKLEEQKANTENEAE